MPTSQLRLELVTPRTHECSRTDMSITSHLLTCTSRHNTARPDVSGARPCTGVGSPVEKKKRNKTYIVIECTDSDRESGSGSSTVRVQISWLIDRPSCKQSDCSCFTLNFYVYFYFYFSFVLSEQRAARLDQLMDILMHFSLLFLLGFSESGSSTVPTIYRLAG